jgi:hypothetical protein
MLQMPVGIRISSQLPFVGIYLPWESIFFKDKLSHSLARTYLLIRCTRLDDILML